MYIVLSFKYFRQLLHREIITWAIPGICGLKVNLVKGSKFYLFLPCLNKKTNNDWIFHHLYKWTAEQPWKAGSQSLK